MTNDVRCNDKSHLMHDARHFLLLKINTALLATLIVLLVIIEYRHYDTEQARIARVAAGEAFARQLQQANELGSRERKLHQERLDAVMRELSEIEERLRK